MEATEHRHFLMNRFDHYYDSTNNKANVFLAVNIFLIGGLFTSLTQLNTYLKYTDTAIACIVIMLGLNIASLIFTLLALIPYARTSGHSLIYFGDIARMQQGKFTKAFTAQSPEALITDLDQQLFYLAKGLCKKFRKLFIAGILFFIEGILLL